jgi:hypothetical protein
MQHFMRSGAQQLTLLFLVEPLQVVQCIAHKVRPQVQLQFWQHTLDLRVLVTPLISGAMELISTLRAQTSQCQLQIH